MTAHACLRPVSFAAAALIACCLVAESARADYRATGGITQTVGNVGGVTTKIAEYDRSAFSDVGGGVEHHDFGPNLPSYHAQADSEGGYGILSAHAFSQWIQPSTAGGGSGTNFSQTASSSIQGTFTDVVVNGPPGGLVPTSFSMHLTGSHLVGSTNTPLNSTSATTTVQVVFSAQGAFMGGGFHTSQATDGGPPVPFSDGFLQNFDGSDVLTSNTFFVPVGTPFTFTVRLEAYASVLGYTTDVPFLLNANADFGNTLTFVTDRPVFDLPAGYTVNSAQAAITDNSFVVPEPAGASTVLILAATALSARARRRISPP